MIYPPPVIAILRKRCTELSLMELQEYVVLTFEAITDLGLFPSDVLAAGTPLHDILPGLFLDIFYGGSSNRSGKYSITLFLILCVLNFDLIIA